MMMIFSRALQDLHRIATGAQHRTRHAGAHAPLARRVVGAPLSVCVGVNAVPCQQGSSSRSPPPRCAAASRHWQEARLLGHQHAGPRALHLGARGQGAPGPAAAGTAVRTCSRAAPGGPAGPLVHRPVKSGRSAAFSAGIAATAPSASQPQRRTCPNTVRMPHSLVLP